VGAKQIPHDVGGVQSMVDLLCVVGEDAVDSLLIEASRDDRTNLGIHLEKALGRRRGARVEEYLSGLVMRTGCLGVRLGASLAFTAGDWAASGEDFDAWLERAMRFGEVDKHTNIPRLEDATE
jgi:hypothetical protein